MAFKIRLPVLCAAGAGANIFFCSTCPIVPAVWDKAALDDPPNKNGCDPFDDDEPKRFPPKALDLFSPPKLNEFEAPPKLKPVDGAAGAVGAGVKLAPIGVPKLNPGVTGAELKDVAELVVVEAPNEKPLVLLLRDAGATGFVENKLVLLLVVVDSKLNNDVFVVLAGEASSILDNGVMDLVIECTVELLFNPNSKGGAELVETSTGFIGSSVGFGTGTAEGFPIPNENPLLSLVAVSGGLDITFDMSLVEPVPKEIPIFVAENDWGLKLLAADGADKDLDPGLGV